MFSGSCEEVAVVGGFENVGVVRKVCDADCCDVTEEDEGSRRSIKVLGRRREGKSFHGNVNQN